MRIETIDKPAAERRAAQEPALQNNGILAEFPELKTLAEGDTRARAAVRVALKDYFSDAGIKAALTDQYVRHFATREGEPAATGYHILSTPKEAAAGGHPAIDGQALFQRFIDGNNANPEDVKDVLFAIRREAGKLKNADNAKLKKLGNLASLAIFDLQRQREIDIRAR